jgi:methylenetetrahydrofolate dehydrogenase (NADP+) / methenyltetrahydrofolate cyclohydrolase
VSHIIDGKTIAQHIHEKTKMLVSECIKKGVTPHLGVVFVGDDKPSATYVRKKGEAAEKLGIRFDLFTYPADITEIELMKEMKRIQAEHELTGLIVQLPIPDHLYTPTVLNAIDPSIDVDCLTNENQGKLLMNTQEILPPTPAAVFSVLESLSVDLVGKNVTLIGVGALVGKPLAVMCINARASVTTINTVTKDAKEKCLNADIIITGVGRHGVLTGDMVREGAIVIDTGIDFVDGKMVGDIVFDEIVGKTSAVTPTPGGVGPITVAHLLANTAQCAYKKIRL